MSSLPKADWKPTAKGAARALLACILAAGMVRSLPAAESVPPPVVHPAEEITAPAQAQTIMHSFLKCWETGDAATFASLLDESLVFAYPGGRFNKTELLQTFRDYQVQKKDIKIYFSDFFVSDGFRHVSSYQFAATDRSTGLRFAVGTGVICRIKSGKITQFKEYWDNEVPGRQKLGELPLDEGMTVAPWPCSVLLREEKIN